MLAGPKVSRVLPFLQQRGFVGEAFASGAQALAHLRRSPCHVLIIELELGDMMGVDLARTGKAEQIVGATLLLEDPIKSGMVISALARGIEAFVPVPPDETVFLERIETLLLAQWGLVVTAQQQQLVDEVARLQALLADAEMTGQEATEQLSQQQKTSARELSDERKKVTELVREIASLRDQLTTMHLVTGAKTGISDEGRAAASQEGDDGIQHGDFDDFPATEAGFDEATLAIPAATARSLLQSEQKTLQRPRAELPKSGARPPGSAGPPAPPALDSVDDGFDFENEATPAGSAPFVPPGQRFGDADEQTAPGGHQLPGSSQEPKKPPKKKNATTANMDADMLKDLARIPTAAEEEIIFIEDD